MAGMEFPRASEFFCPWRNFLRSDIESDHLVGLARFSLTRGNFDVVLQHFSGSDKNLAKFGHTQVQHQFFGIAGDFFWRV